MLGVEEVGVVVNGAEVPAESVGLLVGEGLTGFVAGDGVK